MGQALERHPSAAYQISRVARKRPSNRGCPVLPAFTGERIEGVLDARLRRLRKYGSRHQRGRARCDFMLAYNPIFRYNFFELSRSEGHRRGGACGGGASAVPAGGTTHSAPGRLREYARPASRPVCDFVAGLGQAETDNARLSAASQEVRLELSGGVGSPP